MKTFATSLKIFLFFTILTGVAYPLLVTGIVQALFPGKANGSFLKKEDVIVGSKLIGQSFDSDKYFMSRPSSVSYNPLPSGGSNLALSNPKLKDLVLERKSNFLFFNRLDTFQEVPAEMLFASASGLDPHISPEAALLQVERVAHFRHFNGDQKDKLKQLVLTLSEERQFLCLGEKRINVLVLNLETDKLK
jgi:potassium-transporting ATPase KdpC subunit